ncbi:MAG: hypothetical protein ACP5I1_04590 [Candidatus Hinthialibacter sp.]
MVILSCERRIVLVLERIVRPPASCCMYWFHSFHQRIHAKTFCMESSYSLPLTGSYDSRNQAGKTWAGNGPPIVFTTSFLSEFNLIIHTNGRPSKEKRFYS